MAPQRAAAAAAASQLQEFLEEDPTMAGDEGDESDSGGSEFIGEEPPEELPEELISHRQPQDQKKTTRKFTGVASPSSSRDAAGHQPKSKRVRTKGSFNTSSAQLSGSTPKPPPAPFSGRMDAPSIAETIAGILGYHNPLVPFHSGALREIVLVSTAGFSKQQSTQKKVVTPTRVAEVQPLADASSSSGVGGPSASGTTAPFAFDTAAYPTLTPPTPATAPATAPATSLTPPTSKNKAELKAIFARQKAQILSKLAIKGSPQLSPSLGNRKRAASQDGDAVASDLPSPSIPPSKPAAKRQKNNPSAAKKPVENSKAQQLKAPRRRTQQKVKVENRDTVEDADEEYEYQYPEGQNSGSATKFKPGVRGYDSSLVPVDTIEKMFEKLVDLGVKQNLLEAIKNFGGAALLVATMCSGSESPMLGLQEIQRVLRWKYSLNFHFDQAFAAEIHPAKAAFIDRLGTTPVILRDIVEFITKKEQPKGEFFATTSYGGKVLVEGRLDLLIAGFACDDFSPLNNHKKTLEQKGESGDTFHAILEYMKRFEPSMVILENVSGAPWLHAKLTGKKKFKNGHEQVGIDHHLQDAGYIVVFVRVDSKDFLVPHTRQRGYMLALHAKSLPKSWCTLEGGVLVLKDEKRECFLNTFDAFKCPPSVPAEAFLFRSDDEHLSVLRCLEELIKQGRNNWERCRVGHDDYRHAEYLGLEHPITHWGSDGSRVLPDYYKPFLGMSERVLDSIDIAHLRNLRRGIDDRYYSRILELSQNVYRVIDVTKNGLIGCCMPSNLLWSTVEGRRITGLEALMFQATPVHLADYNNMSEALLHDLAGNAMTSTVVTAFALAALIEFGSMLKMSNRSPKVPEPKAQSEFEGADSLVSGGVFPSHYYPISFANITQKAALTCRLCYCESQTEISSRTIRQCKTCKQTACTKCGVEPEHNYDNMSQSFLDSRQNPVEFEKVIRGSIPNEIDLSNWLSVDLEQLRAALERAQPTQFSAEDWSSTILAIEKALKSRVFLRNIRRTWCWELTFDSADAKVKLSISKDNVEWLVYANVPDEPLGSVKGKHLRRFPLARMQPKGSDILHGQWSFWIPEARHFAATIISHGELIETFQCQRGLLQGVNTTVYSKMGVALDEPRDIRYLPHAIEGDYNAVPACGQSFNSFHVLQSTVGEDHPVALFRDVPLREGEPSNSRFVISKQFERLDYGEYRTSAAEVFHFNQPVVRVNDDAIGNIPLSDRQEPLKKQVSIAVQGYWTSLMQEDVECQPPTTILQRQLAPTHPVMSTATCGMQHYVLDLLTKLPSSISKSLMTNNWQTVDRTNLFKFWRELGWVLSKSSVLEGHTESNSEWHSLVDEQHRCARCAPIPPNLIWAYKKVGDLVGKLEPHEDPKRASEYEKLMRNLPHGLSIVYRAYGEPSSPNLGVRIAMDPATLIHRAKALLPPGDHTSEVDLSWRLVTDDCHQRKPVLDQFILPSSADMKLGLDPFKGKVVKIQQKIVTLKLFDEQNQTLQWMIQQEKNPPVFVEQEIVEAKVRELRYRLEGRVSREKVVAGGVLAQGVGFGKTIVTLGLIAANRTHTERQIKEERAKNSSGLVPTKATFIIVPPHLCDQWRDEIALFLPPDTKVLVIKTIVNLKKYMLKDFIEADIVIADWSIFTSDAYMQSLAQFAGLIPPASLKNGRLLRTWYEAALKRVESNLRELKSDPSSFLDLLSQQFKESAAQATSAEVPIPSKHITGAAYKNSDARMASPVATPKAELGKDGKKKKKKKKKKVEKFDPTFKGRFSMANDDENLFKYPLFEMMKWGRIIIDEYSYLDSHLMSAVELLNAFCKWILSATPRQAGFDDVKAMATLLGIHLGIDDFSRMKEDIKAKKIADLTNTEEMLALLDVSSPSFAEHRHKQAQAFINAFLRHDVAKYDHIPMVEKIVLVHPSPAEKAVYIEQQQNQAANQFQTRRTKATGGHREQMAREQGFQTDGKQALFMRASHFSFREEPDAEPIKVNATEQCEKIEELREQQLGGVLKRFREEVVKGYWLQDMLREKEESASSKTFDSVSTASFSNFLARVKSNHFSDPDATASLGDAIDEAKSEVNDDSWKRFYRDPTVKKDDQSQQGLLEYPVGEDETADGRIICRLASALRLCTSVLNRIAHDVISHQQAFRLFKNMRAIQTKEAKCNCCNSRYSDPAELTLLTRCGHTTCQSCSATSNNTCPIDGCGTSYSKEYQRVNGANLFGESYSKDSSRFGSKIDQVVKLIKSFKSEQKVLIFVQYDNIDVKLKEALSANNIRFSDLANGFKSSIILKGFKQAGDKRSRSDSEESENDDDSSEAFKFTVMKGKESQVLILKPDDAEAAGSNLTIANNLIFLGPIYTTGSDAQAVYNAAKTQAIGRSRRHGQTRLVQVYHFLTSQTIDVDYFEVREGKFVHEIKSLNELSKSDAAALAKDPAYKKFKLKFAKLTAPVAGSHGPHCSSSANFVSFDDVED
ncbi:hypothetical protein BDZ45DRAFT_748912 [Acephala macrosclerotiorum]|nr:hypothetical protein BDZ45DRAFT_748912 [Acephala macrosclerotiorum]